MVWYLFSIFAAVRTSDMKVFVRRRVYVNLLITAIVSLLLTFPRILKFLGFGKVFELVVPRGEISGKNENPEAENLRSQYNLPVIMACCCITMTKVTQ